MSLKEPLLVVESTRRSASFGYSCAVLAKTVVGTGHAAKEQVLAMVKVLLPGCGVSAGDAADALAVAICHAQHRRHASLAATLR